jgi:hypothetical protein
LAPKAEA